MLFFPNFVLVFGDGNRSLPSDLDGHWRWWRPKASSSIRGLRLFISWYTIFTVDFFLEMVGISIGCSSCNGKIIIRTIFNLYIYIQSATCTRNSLIVFKYLWMAINFNFCRELFSDEPISGENSWPIGTFWVSFKKGADKSETFPDGLQWWTVFEFPTIIIHCIGDSSCMVQTVWI